MIITQEELNNNIQKQTEEEVYIVPDLQGTFSILTKLNGLTKDPESLAKVLLLFSLDETRSKTTGKKVYFYNPDRI